VIIMTEHVNTTQAANKQYAELFKKPGPWITVYVDASTGTVDSLRAGDVLPERLRESLEKQGAAKADVKAVIDAVSPATGVPSPVSRYILVSNGQAEVNEVLPGEMAGPEIVSMGPIPDLVPLLKARGDDFPYVVAEVGRDGGEVHLQYARQNGVAETTTVEGDRENLTKVPGGGWSQGRYQHRTEEIWRKNADEIAGEIDRVVQASKARLLIIAGDIRARELVVEQLSDASRAIESTIESHTRTGGADKDALRAEIAARVAHVWTEQRKTILDRLANATGQAHEWTAGLGDCIRALQQAQAGTLIFHDAALADHEVLALTAEPWIATSGEEQAGAEVLAKLPAPAALVRAAVLTDARVKLVPENALPGGKNVAALLRWPTGPEVPRG
jgi:hypothetical protein